MCIGRSAFLKALILLTLLFIPSSVTYAQGSTPAAAPTPAPDFATQEELTGEWGGARSRWEEKGVELEFKFYQFAPRRGIRRYRYRCRWKQQVSDCIQIRFWKTRWLELLVSRGKDRNALWRSVAA